MNDEQNTQVNNMTQTAADITNACTAINLDALQNLWDNSRCEKQIINLAGSPAKFVTAVDSGHNVTLSTTLLTGPSRGRVKMEPERLLRKRAAILYADVAGYSRLVGEDEEGTHRMVSAYLDLFTVCIRRHHGNVDHFAGDAVLADFGAAVNAMECALEIQQTIKQRNSNLPSSKRVEFRIGINLGNVIVDRGEVHGDSVNVAARLESLADPGCVCISDTVRTAVGNKLPLTYEFMGEQHVKNISEPVKAYHIKFLPGAELPKEPLEAPQPLQFGIGHRPSLIVLPFHNLSNDDSQQYFCDGVTNDLATDLSKFWNLVVVSGLAAVPFDGKTVNAREVSRELNVRYLLEGSVRKLEDRVRINVQLIEGETGHHLWAERFDRNVSDLFALQDEIIQAIVVSLSLNVGTLEEKRAMRRERIDLDAYDAYLKGFHLWRGHLEKEESFTSLLEAQQWLNLATELDPDFSRPWGLLTYTYVWGWQYWWFDDGILEKARQCVEKALDLDPLNHDNHYDLAYYYLTQREFDLAMREYHAAQRLNRNDVLLQLETAEMHCYLGKHERATELVKETMALNPYYPDHYAASLAWIHYFMLNYESSLELLSSVRHVTTDVLKLSAAAHAQLAAQCKLENQRVRALHAETQAKESLKSFLQRRPDWTVQKERRLATFRRQEDEQHWYEGLRKAGLKEE
jgi:TolB-like protein/class 3 adenylate cyclase